jgi:hypothetical protein
LKTDNLVGRLIEGTLKGGKKKKTFRTKRKNLRQSDGSSDVSAQSGELSHRQLAGMHRNPSAQANWSGPVHLTASPS